MIEGCQGDKHEWVMKVLSHLLKWIRYHKIMLHNQVTTQDLVKTMVAQTQVENRIIEKIQEIVGIQVPQAWVFQIN